MKKNLAIAIIAILLVVVAVFAYFRITGRDLPFGLNGGKDSSEEQGFLGKLADAIKIGTAMKCVVSEGDVNATFYLKSGKLRGEVTSPTDGEVIQYIMRDNCMYYWSEEEQQGLKWCWDAAEAASWEEQVAAATENYDCKPQTISDSKFSIPSGIDFTDMSEYMQQYVPTE